MNNNCELTVNNCFVLKAVGLHFIFNCNKCMERPGNYILVYSYNYLILDGVLIFGETETNLA